MEVLYCEKVGKSKTNEKVLICNITKHKSIGTEHLLRLYWDGMSLKTKQYQGKLFSETGGILDKGEIYQVTQIRKNLK